MDTVYVPTLSHIALQNAGYDLMELVAQDIQRIQTGMTLTSRIKRLILGGCGI